jgi:myxalamid-type polyketide synthase MxaE and MxaD
MSKTTPSTTRSSEPPDRAEPIAVVGIGCRFPGGVNSPESFWDLLKNEVDAITEIPASRMNIEALFDPRPATPGRIMTHWGGFLDDIDQFDASFFGMSPREADRLDPQQRLILEVAWEAMEDAGEQIGTETTLNGGVFVGCWLNDYEGRLFRDPDQIDFYMTTGSGRYSIPGRLSYFLGMQGPSISVDTACSSSLVAVHLACQSLRNRECALALAGGTNVILQPSISIAYSQSRMMAPDGRCKFGDASGNGYVRSEGAALIALKRLSDAIADNNPIYAVIRGSAVNNDGRSSGFLTTPGGAGQEDMLRKAYINANLSPGDVQYIEAHGTGTRAGDPVEIQALGAVMKQNRPAGQFCKVGSVKTNFGHTEGAAGVAGLIKVALSLKNRYIPASLHFKEPNPAIPWDDLPIRIQSKGEPWPEHDGPAVGGVSAFGIAGTNAHIVLEEAPVLNQPDVQSASSGEHPDASMYLVPLSARSPSALRDLVQNIKGVIESNTSFSLEDLGYTASLRRSHNEYRTSFTAASLQGLDEEFSHFLEDWQEYRFPLVEPTNRKILFIFPGQGSQWAGMGIQIMKNEPVFRAALERCSRAIEPLTGWSLIDILLSKDINERLEQIDFIQPALFAMQVALAEQWRAWGIAPDAVAGHSMGEIAAAYSAGAISLEDAARVICQRSQLMKTVSGKGAMISVDLSLEDSRVAIKGYEDKISIAVSNSPRSTVLSGDPTAIEEVSTNLKGNNILFRQVKVDVAAHSPQMEALRPLLEQKLEGLQPYPTTIPIYSTVTAKLEEGLTFDVGYWGRNLRQPVLFSTVLKQALDDGFDTIIEISPHPVLLAAVEQGFKIFKADSNATFSALPSARRNENEQVILLQSLGKLYELGHPINWAILYPRKANLVKLPAYPWQREYFWLEVENPQAGSAKAARSGKNPLSGSPVSSLDAPSAFIREIILDKKNFPELYALQVHGVELLPHSAYLEIARTAAAELLGSGPIEMNHVQFQHSMRLSADRVQSMQIVLSPSDGDWHTFRIVCRDGIDWIPCVSGQISLKSENGNAVKSKENHLHQLDATSKHGTLPLTAQQFYSMFNDRDVHIEKPLQTLDQIQIRTDAALATVQSEYGIYILSMEPVLQLAAALQGGSGDDTHAVYLPKVIEEICLYGPLENGVTIWGTTHSAGSSNQAKQNFAVVSADGQLLMEMRGIQLEPRSLAAIQNIDEWLYEVEWQPVKTTPGTTGARQEMNQTGGWLILADSCGYGSALAARLEKQGQPCKLVYRNNQTVFDDGWFHHEMLSMNGNLRGIIYLWALDLNPVLNLNLSDMEKAHEFMRHSAVQILRGITAENSMQTPRLWFITRGAQPPPSSNLAPALEQAPMWGLGRVIAEESPDLWGGLIDIDPGLAIDQATDLLCNDIMDAQETQLAYYGNQRLALRLKRKGNLREVVRWRSDASYLITGGLGGIGLEAARWMVQQGARHIILMGRTPLPPRSEWTKLSQDEPSGKKIRAIRALEAMGASVHLAAIDATNENELRGWLELYKAEGWPPIRGMMHAAGVLRSGLVDQAEKEDWNSVLRAKVRGSWLLHTLLDDLDFFVLFSSISAVIGPTGQGSYAMANSFLDSLAQFRRTKGLPALSINWGPWEGVGMTADSRVQITLNAWENQGIASITANQGMAVLAHLLSAQDAAQIMVFPVNWEKLRQSHLSANLKNLLSNQLVAPQVKEQAPTSVRDNLLALNPDQRRGHLEAFLQQQIAQVLKLPPARIVPSKPLGSFGLDSLMAIELRTRLETVLDISLSATFVWSYPTLAQMGPYIAEKMEIPLTASEASSQHDASPSVGSTPPAKAQPEETEVALEDILAEIEELSDDNVQQLLKDTTSNGKPNE